MMIAELHITREGLERARSQAMLNTPSALRAEYAQRNLSDAVFIATVFIAMAREVLGRLASLA